MALKVGGGGGGKGEGTRSEGNTPYRVSSSQVHLNFFVVGRISFRSVHYSLTFITVLQYANGSKLIVLGPVCLFCH